MLPQDFVNRMKQMLGEEYLQFEQSYEQEKYRALRINPLKGDHQLSTRMPFDLTTVPWSRHGFYYGNEERPGKHPYHEAGVYYIQEPSAMAPAEYLDARPGEYVLDLCAAPGGKSTQIAAAMQGKGLLISNEIHPARAKILSENIERMGVVNAIVTNESPQSLRDKFQEYFDRIMVDAPCSGEGMFRKNEDATGEWSLENVKICADRQDEILACADEMLRPGGRIVYSTCTFAPDENEGTISRFMKMHPDYQLVPVSKAEGMSEGRSDWVENPAEGLEHTIRLWPHRLHGEGHYLAVLQKAGTPEDDGHYRLLYGSEPGVPEKECKEYLMFRDEFIRKKMEGKLLKFGEQLYLAPEETPSLKGIKVLRPGLHLGTLKKNRFEPSHALALALQSQEVRYTVDLSSDDKTIYDYLNGQTFSLEGDKGWYLITIDGHSIGWGKLAGTMMKNHYPKGLRKQI